MTEIKPYKCVLRRDGRVLHVADCNMNVANAQVAARIAHAYLADFPHEEVIALVLNSQNQITDLIKLGQGGMHGCALTPKDVLRPVLLSGEASGFILAHNHPSGDPTPSPEDITMTEVLETAADLVGLCLLDHLVVTRSGRYTSIKAEYLGP